MMTVSPRGAPALAPISSRANPLDTWLDEVETEAEGEASSGIPDAPPPREPAPTASNVRKRGARPMKLQRVKEAMERDLREGRQSAPSLRTMLEKAWPKPTACPVIPPARRAMTFCRNLSKIRFATNSDKRQIATRFWPL